MVASPVLIVVFPVRALLLLLLLLLLLSSFGSSSSSCAFLLVHPAPPRPQQQQQQRARSAIIHKERRALLRAVPSSSSSSSTAVDEDGSTSLPATTSSTSTSAPDGDDDGDRGNPPIVDRSTLTLLERVRVNVPADPHRCTLVPFYGQLLGCGGLVDPARPAAENGRPDEDAPPTTTTSTVLLVADCGASQLHLVPCGGGDPAHRPRPGPPVMLIGLRIRPARWPAFVERCRREQSLLLDGGGGGGGETTTTTAATATATSCIRSVEEGGGASTSDDGKGRRQPTSVRLVDRCGNAFLCRPEDEPQRRGGWNNPPQPVPADSSDCAGIDFCEFLCPAGAARPIAQFYERVFDATASVVRDSSGSGSGSGVDVDVDVDVAVIAIGNVRATGRADQSLLFREAAAATAAAAPPGAAVPPDGDCHPRIVLRVGETAADFDQAFRNAVAAGAVDPRSHTLEGARRRKRFRFRDVIDLETGRVVAELDHELRSSGAPGGVASGEDAGGGNRVVPF